MIDSVLYFFITLSLVLIHLALDANNPPTYKLTHTPTVVQSGMDKPPPPSGFLFC